MRMVAVMIFLMAAFCMAVAVWNGVSAQAAPSHDFPRVAAWQLNANKTPVKELARFDVVILDMNAQQTNPSLAGELRALNPNIVILAYTSPIEYPRERLDEVEPNGNGLWHDLGVGLADAWVLKTHQGANVSFWPGNVAMNLGRKDGAGKNYATHLADFLTDRVLASGYWDGLLFDTVWQNVSWFDENIDINGDGKKDTRQQIDEAWYKGQETLFARLRERSGNKYLLLTNGDGQYNKVNNGRMFESFPEYWEGGWTGSVDRYFGTERDGYAPRFNIINSDTDNTGNFRSYGAMRFGLMTSLLANGYYNFDYGTQDRSFTPYYDEYTVNLGRPVGSAFNLTEANKSVVSLGLWRRDFENGVSLVNSSTTTRTYVLPGEFETIHGQQDPYVNNGRVVSKVTIAPLDGQLLLRPLQEIIGAVYTNGSYTRVFSGDARAVRSSFFSFDERFAGSQWLMKEDIDGDGTLETVVADASSIIVYRDQGQIQTRIYPYGEAFKGGLTFALGDVNGDGRKDIVVGPQKNYEPLVKAYTSAGKVLNTGFYAYAKNFRGGVNVAVGDVNGDGKNEIITGAGFGGGPHVRVFAASGKVMNDGFFAYKSTFRGGTFVAAGDIDGDGDDEIITGAGPTGGPHVRVWTTGNKMQSEFFAFSARSSAGVRVSVIDSDQDGRAEIVATTSDVLSQ